MPAQIAALTAFCSSLIDAVEQNWDVPGRPTVRLVLDTARLLTQVAPLVFVDGTFALKGGTAINLFLRNMPRLSVDLDLVFPDHSLPRVV